MMFIMIHILLSIWLKFLKISVFPSLLQRSRRTLQMSCRTQRISVHILYATMFAHLSSSNTMACKRTLPF